MQNTRQEILNYLRTHQIVSAIEISRALHMTAANARHHLALLEEQQMVEAVGQRPPKGRGRPTTLFTLTHQAMEDNIDLLVDALFKVMLSNADPVQPFDALIPLLFGSPTSGANRIQQLNQVIQTLNEMTYQARWEASPAGPRIIFGHCPYAAILNENPELCQMDESALAMLLGLPVEQLAKLTRNAQGKVNCVFALKQD